MTLFKKYLVKRGRQEIEPQEVFLDGLAQKKEGEARIREMRFEVPPSRKALIGLLIFSLAAVLILFSKAFQLVVLEGKAFKDLADRNFSRISPIRADRGIIYDRSLKKLVSNLPSFDLVLDKIDLPKDQNQRAQEIEKIAGIIKKEPQILGEEIESSKEEKMLIAENLSHEDIVLLETEIRNLPGFQIEKNTVRDYFEGPSFAQVIGYTGRINAKEYQNLKQENYFVSDYLGKQGLEKSYEEILRGKPGVFEIQKDAVGKKVKEGIKTEAVSGQSLVLWLDSDLQEKLQEELARISAEIGTKKAAAVALDPKTGGVLALVSLPSFDNNLFSKGISQKTLDKILNDPNQPLFNRTVSGQYASGSTIKPLIAASALQEKIISPEKQIYDQGFIEIQNQYDPEITYVFHDLEPHGWVNMKKAIAVSCNVYFYTIGGGYKGQKGLGSTKIKNYLNLFNWGQPTNIDLPQETSGLIPDHRWKEENINEAWYTGDTYNLSIGQGYLQVSPLQVATAFSAIANNGKIMKPQIVAKIVDGRPDDQKVVKEFLPQTIRELPIDQKNLEIVREGMRDAVIYGSSAILAGLPVKAAAKTGTAQTPRANYYDNWVTVFAPYDNPEIVLTVLIEDVPGVRAAALPVANETLKWYFTK
ncbi:MAG: penicillin-binding protein 2 [bacterium]|nr:penicillin-binding protein 2 [bacterium]